MGQTEQEARDEVKVSLEPSQFPFYLYLRWTSESDPQSGENEFEVILEFSVNDGDWQVDEGSPRDIPASERDCIFEITGGGAGTYRFRSKVKRKNVGDEFHYSDICTVWVVKLSGLDTDPSGKEIACTDESVTFKIATVAGSPVDHYGGIIWKIGETQVQVGGETYSRSWDSVGTKTVTATCCGTTVNRSIEIIDGLTVFPNKAYVCVNGTKNFEAWACVGGAAQNVTANSSFTTDKGSMHNNTLTASSSPSTSKGANYVKATYSGQTTDSTHDCDLTVFKVEITTPTSTAMNITNAPAMPSPTFHADIEPEEVLSMATFKWYLDMTFNHDTQGTIEHRVPTSGTDNIEGSENWTPNWGGLLAGGNVHVYVKVSVAGSSEAEHDQSGYQIQGTNPTQAQIFAVADLRVRSVCWVESSHRQFDATRYTGIGVPLPSYAHDGGYGLMQPTPASEAQVWNWSENASAGISLLNTNYSQSVQHVNNINTPGIAPDPDPTPNPPLSLTNDEHWLNALSLYRAGTYYWGYEHVQGTEYRWVRNSGTGPDYADSIVQLMNDPNPPWQ